MVALAQFETGHTVGGDAHVTELVPPALAIPETRYHPAAAVVNGISPICTR